MADINYNALPEKLTASVSTDKVLILDSEDWDKVKQQSATLFQWPQGNPWTDGTDWLDVTWRWAYAWGTTYAINDAVSYNGSSYICILSSTWNLPTNTTYWNVMASKGADGAWGDVVWPASSTDNAIARYDGTTGKLIQNSGATIDDSGNITATNLSGTNTGDNAANSNSWLVHTTWNETIWGTKTFSSDVLVPDEAYGAWWNGSLEVPTKNAVYDKIETLWGLSIATWVIAWVAWTQNITHWLWVVPKMLLIDWTQSATNESSYNWYYDWTNQWCASFNWVSTTYIAANRWATITWVASWLTSSQFTITWTWTPTNMYFRWTVYY